MTTRILPTSARSIARAPKLNLTRRGRFVFIGVPLITGAAALLVVAVIFLLPTTVQANSEPVGDPVTPQREVALGFPWGAHPSWEGDVQAPLLVAGGDIRAGV